MIPVFKVKLVRAGSTALPAPSLSEPRQFHTLAFHKFIGQADREHCALMMFSQGGSCIGLSLIGVGGMNVVAVSSGMLFRVALLTNASRVIIAHNHPSGAVDPSPEDVKATGRLQRAGWLIGIEVVDHVIVSPSRSSFVSMAERGLLGEGNGAKA